MGKVKNHDKWNDLKNKHLGVEIGVDSYGDEIWFGGTGRGIVNVGGWTNGGCMENDDEWQQLYEEAVAIAELLHKMKSKT